MVLKGLMVYLSIRICGFPLSKYIYFTLFGNSVWLNIVTTVVASPIIPVIGRLVAYFLIYLEISLIAITTFDGRLIDGGCFPGPVPGCLLPDPELGPDVGNGSSEMSSNLSGLNEGLKCRLLMLR